MSLTTHLRFFLALLIALAVDMAITVARLFDAIRERLRRG